jgi:hypothetical protein
MSARVEKPARCTGKRQREALRTRGALLEHCIEKPAKQRAGESEGEKTGRKNERPLFFRFALFGDLQLRLPHSNPVRDDHALLLNSLQQSARSPSAFPPLPSLDDALLPLRQLLVVPRPLNRRGATGRVGRVSRCTGGGSSSKRKRRCVPSPLFPPCLSPSH